MPGTEYDRHQLFTWCEEHMGRERAATLMSLLPPVGWADVATKRDVDQLQATTKRDLDQLHAATKRDLDDLERRLTTGIENTQRNLDDLEARLTARIDSVDRRMDVELDAKLERLRSELLRTFGTWLFASQATVIAALSLVIAVA